MNRALLADFCLNSEPSVFFGGRGAGPMPIDFYRIRSLDDGGLGGPHRDNWIFLPNIGRIRIKMKHNDVSFDRGSCRAGLFPYVRAPMKVT